MTPVDFPEANARFGPPDGIAESQVMVIRAHVGKVIGGSMDGEQLVVTAWQPTPEELGALAAGKPLFISFLGGLPPHFPTVDFQLATHPA